MLSLINLIIPDCDDVYYPMDLYLRHIQEEHQSVYDCQDCGKTVPAKDFFPHLWSHKKGPFDCMYCDFGARDGKTIKRHVINNHPNEHPYICVRFVRDLTIRPNAIESMSVFPVVNEEVVDESIIKMISKEAFDELGQDKDDVCSLKISSVHENYVMDDEDQHNHSIDKLVEDLPKRFRFDEEISCHYCSFKSQVKVHLIRHMQVHKLATKDQPTSSLPKSDENSPEIHKKRNYSKQRLSASFVTLMQTELLRHIQEAPRFVPLKLRLVCGAKYCRFSTINEKLFKVHLLKTHSDDKIRFKCPHCNFDLTADDSCDMETIFDHYRLHDENLYRCSQCKYFGAARKDIVKHVEQSHSGCDSESEVIKIRCLDYRKRIKTHPDLRFECQYCDLVLCDYDLMQNHVQARHGFKSQFECGWCNKDTISVNGMKLHTHWKHPGKIGSVIVHFKSIIIGVSTLKRKLTNREEIIPNKRRQRAISNDSGA